MYPNLRQKQTGTYRRAVKKDWDIRVRHEGDPCCRNQWKGSVCAFLSEMLTLAGKRPPFYLSASGSDQRTFPDQQCTDQRRAFLESYQKVQAAIDGMVKTDCRMQLILSLLYAVAMVAFQKEKAEYVVLETGLGGRLDATNTIEHPIATVITSDQPDHTEILGDTIEKIAGEKAGIIKEGVPVIYDGRNEEAEKVIKNRPKELHAPAFALKEEMYEILGNTDKSVDFCLNCGYYEHAKVTAPYLAPYQVVNSSLGTACHGCDRSETGDLARSSYPGDQRDKMAGDVWRPFCRV